MQVVYTGEPFPESWKKSIFLAGPTPRSKMVKSWRPEAIRILSELSYDGVVFYPEDRDGTWRRQYDDQVNWEHAALDAADCILFWIPRKLKTMPAFTTNIELGLYAHSGRVVVGAPKNTPKMRYPMLLAKQVCAPVAVTLEETIRNVLQLIGDGAERHGAECQVPLVIWNTTMFQAWYQNQRRAGNRLDGARPDFVCRVGKDKNFVFCFILRANIHVASENRNKTNEFVITRPDTTAVVMYRKDAKDILDSRIVLVREFRTPAATPDGFIWEVPSGSSRTSNSPREVAIEEIDEETGLVISAERLVEQGVRQSNGTFSAHRANLFSVELTESELVWLESQKGIAHGANLEDPSGEKTYIEIRTIREIMSQQFVDWSMIGMIFKVLVDQSRN